MAKQLQNILVIETTTSSCQVALFSQGILYQKKCEGLREHSKKLLPFIDELLKQAKLLLKDVDYIALTIGPGSFTGMRLGLACVQSIQLVHQIPIIGLSTLAAISASFLADKDFGKVYICQDAKMSEVSFAIYEKANGMIDCLQKDMLLKPDQVVIPENFDQKVYFIGDGWQFVQQDLSKLNSEYYNQQVAINTSALIKLAEHAIIQQNYISNLSDLNLNYLRDENAWQKN